MIHLLSRNSGAAVRDALLSRSTGSGSMHQRLAAEGAVKHLQGVQDVDNDITLAAPSRPLVEAPAEGRALWRS